MHPDAHLHRLDRKSFQDLLSGGGDSGAVKILRAGEWSWRLLLLRALVAAAVDVPTGPVPALDDGWQLLCRARAAAPEAVERLLLYPAVGTWAAHALRRVRGAVEGADPLWVEIGHLHTVAAAAALLAGIDFGTVVPVREGWVVLPSLGGVKLPGDSRGLQAVPMSAYGGRVRVGDTEWGGPGFHPLTELRADGCSLLLDDIDPYRGLRGPAAPSPVDSSERWRDLFTEAWTILVHDDAEEAKALATGLASIVPRARTELFRPHSASSGDAFGAAVASEPDDAEQLASTLVHEFQHNKLGALMHLFTLYEHGGTALYYAPWRDDPRPIGGLLQGVYAFLGVTSFWRRRASPLGMFEFALWRRQTVDTLHAIRAAEELNVLGRQLVDRLTERLAPWLDERVSPEAQAAADCAAEDHRASWRAFHLQPDPETVRRHARAWVEGGSVAVADGRPTVVPGKPDRGLDTRAVLLRRRLTDPSGFQALRSAPGTAVSGARREDAALVAGEAEAARDAFLTRIARERDPDAWVGLGLALRATGRPGAAALLRCPELVMAVHAELEYAPDPVRLACAFG